MKNFYSFRLLALLTVLSALFFINSCDNAPTGPKGDIFIQGILTDQAGEPIPDAVLEIVETNSAKMVVLEETVIERDTTDEDGNFSFEKIPTDLDAVDLRILHPDLKPFQEKLGDVLIGEDKNDMKVEAQYQDSCCGKIVVNVFSAEDSSVVSDVELRLNVENKFKRKGKTGDKGSYTFNEVCKYEYWLRLYKAGYEVAEIENIKVDGCEESDYVEVNVYLYSEDRDSCCNGVLQVIPKDKETGEVIKGATIKLRKNGVVIRKGSNEGDYVQFEELCEGDYELVVLKEGYEGAEIKVTMDCDDEKEVTVELMKRECCDGAIFLQVVDDSTRNGIEKAQVLLYKSGKKQGIYYTNSDGKLKLTGLCEGEYGLDISKKEYKTIEFEQKIECNDTVEITKALVSAKNDSCCEGVVKIYPKDSKTKEVLNGVLVKLFKNGSLTEKIVVNNGVAIFDGLCEGKYSFLLSREGYESMDFEAEVECNETYEYKKYLVSNNSKDSCCNGVIKVLVRDENRNALQYAKVILWKDGKALEYGKTNGDGYAVFDGLCEGGYVVSIQREGYTGTEFELKLDCDETKTIEKTLTKSSKDSCCDGVIKVYVSDDNGKALQYAKVVLKQKGQAVEDGKTNGDGYVVFDGLCEGEYYMSIQREGYTGTEFEFKLDCDETKTIKKTLTKNSKDSCCDGVIKVYVSDDNGKALQYAKVVLKQKGQAVEDGKTNGDGYVVFDGLCEGEYYMSIQREGYTGTEFEFKLDCDETKTIKKTLTKNSKDSCCDGVVKVYVRDGNRNALQYAKVVLWQNGKAVESGKTNSDGYVEFDGLCEGEYGMSIDREGYKGVEFEFKLDCNETKTIEKTLTKNSKDSCCDGKIKVIIKDENGKAVSYVRGKLSKSGKVIKEAKSNGDGIIVYEELCEGSYVIRLSKYGYKVIEMEIDVDCNEVVEIKKTIQKEDSCCTAVMKLILRDGDNKAVSKAKIEVYKDRKKIADGYSNADGGWAEDGLCAPATYTVVVKKDGFKDKEFTISYEWCTTEKETVKIEKE